MTSQSAFGTALLRNRLKMANVFPQCPAGRQKVWEKHEAAVATFINVREELEMMYFCENLHDLKASIILFPSQKNQSPFSDFGFIAEDKLCLWLTHFVQQIYAICNLPFVVVFVNVIAMSKDGQVSRRESVFGVMMLNVPDSICSLI